MVKMLKLGKAAGPCNLCGATGMVELWDVEGEYEPCQGCKGTGHNTENFIVIERESGRTKFKKRCEILEEAMLSSSDVDAEFCEWAEDNCQSWDYLIDVTPGVYLARMYNNGQARRKSAEPFVDVAFQHLLDYYNWKQDMGFAELDEITSGGQFWSEAEESNG